MSDDNEDDGGWECPVDNCSVWYPSGMEFLSDDHKLFHDAIKQAYVDGYKRSLWELYDRSDEKIEEWAENSFRFRGEYDWWNVDADGSGTEDERTDRREVWTEPTQSKGSATTVEVIEDDDKVSE